MCYFVERAWLSVPRRPAGSPALQCSLSEAWPHLPAGDKRACHTQGIEFVQGHSVLCLAQNLYSLGSIPSVLNSPGSDLARTQSNNYNNKNNNDGTEYLLVGVPACHVLLRMLTTFIKGLPCASPFIGTS